MSTDFIIDAVERPPKTWVRVVDRLQGLILGKKLAPGSKLPPERQLCQQLGVSRTVLREAIKHLSAVGLVEEITGRGTFVSRPNLDAVRRSLQVCLGWHAQAVLENLVELRRLIEVEIAGLAAMHATEEEIQSLGKNVAEMETEVGPNSNVQKFMNLDLEFHSGLARATHNELFVMLFDAISGAMVGIWEKMHNDPEERKHGIQYHKKILSAIEQRNPQDARTAVRDNIESFKRDLAAQAEQSEASPNAVTLSPHSDRRRSPRHLSAAGEEPATVPGDTELS
jgi:GntR family transcriptional regulator, transcriptional repressor for pyruvate dehydrogenase complex